MRSCVQIFRNGCIEAIDGVMHTAYPWSGTKVMRTLELFARREHVTPLVDILSLHYSGWNEERLRLHWRSMADFERAPTELSELMASKCFEKFDAFVPLAVLHAASARDRLDLSGTLAVAANAGLFGGLPMGRAVAQGERNAEHGDGRAS